MSLLELGNTKKGIPTSMEKKKTSRNLQQIRILMDVGNFPAINKQENDKRCIKSPMCCAKHGVKLLDQLPIRLFDPGVSFKCQACRGEPSCASSSTN